jgi:two-component system, LytTR family, response regulator
MIKSIIIENDQMNVEYICNILSKHFPEIEILDVCATVPEGVDKIKYYHPHLVFLDVELPPYTGFDLLEQTRDMNYKVIFTTSFNKYAAKAFRFCALDFITKPFGVDDLREAINRYKEVAASNAKKSIEALLHNVKQTDSSRQKVGIPVIGGYDFITVSDIIMCKSEDNCTDFYLTNQKRVTATKTLKWVDEMLSEHHFHRIHDSYLINLNHIIKYKKGGEGGVVELSEQKEADVSRRRKDDFLKALSDMKMIHKN